MDDSVAVRINVIDTLIAVVLVQSQPSVGIMMILLLIFILTSSDCYRHARAWNNGG